MLLGAVLIWSLNFSISKYALARFAPLAFTAPRYALAGIIFGAVAFRREKTLRILPSDIRLVLTAAVVGIWLNQVAFIYALHLAGAATVSLLFGTAPILVALFAHLSGIERLSRRAWFATALSGGVAILVVGSGGNLSGSLGGVILCLVSASTWAFYSVALVPLTQTYSPYRLSAVLSLAGAVPLLLFVNTATVASGLGINRDGRLVGVRLRAGAELRALEPRLVSRNRSCRSS